MTETSCTPETIARLAVRRLQELSDPVRAAGAERYFKHTIKAFGATAAQVRGLAADLFKAVKGRWTLPDAVSLCEMLLARPELEAKAIGCLILNRFKNDFPPSILERIEGWLAGDLLDNWASVDTFCTDAMAALLMKYPELIVRVKSWACHPNRWVKRASAVSFIKLARRKNYLPPIYEISASLFPVDDDLVQKANGWMLREAGKSDMNRLERFLLRHGPAIPRTTVRYAIERFDEKKRRELLLRTR